jgi:hypothetical protein
MGPLSRIYEELQYIEYQAPKERLRRLKVVNKEARALLKSALARLSTSKDKQPQK